MSSDRSTDARMTWSRTDDPDDDLLQRLLDGEVDDEERATAEARIHQDPENAAGLARHRRLGTLVRAAVEEHHLGEPVLSPEESDALFAAIAEARGLAVHGAAVRAEAESGRPAGSASSPDLADRTLRAIPGGRADRPASGSAGSTPVATDAEQVGAQGPRPLSRERAAGVRLPRSAAVAGIVAIAAAIGLVFYRAPEPRGGAGGVGTGRVAVGEAGPRGTHVLEVDFGSNTGTVFEVEGDQGEPLAVVVWIDDPMPAPRDDRDPGEGG